MMLLLRSAGIALLVLLCGWGALTWYWFSEPQDAKLLGFYDYPSAVWGDGLLLPVLAAVLVYSIGRLPKPKHHYPLAVAAILGLLVGGLVILGWVSDPNPGLNWTMPAPHYLNNAGKWHAGFLIGASALFAMLWAELVHRLHSAFRASSTRVIGISLLRSGLFALIVGTTFGYAALAGRDSARVGTTDAGASSLYALVGSALFLALGLAWAARRDIAEAFASTIGGVFLASFFVCLALMPPSSVVAILLTAMAAAAGLSFAMTAEPAVQGEDIQGTTTGARGSPALEWLAVPALFGVVPLISQHAGFAPSRLLPAAGAVVVVLLLTLGFRRFRRRAKGLGPDTSWFLIAALFLGTSFGVLVLIQAPDLGFHWRPILLALAAAGMSQIALVPCQADYARLMELEQSEIRKSSGGIAPPQEIAEQKGIWGRIGAAGVAAALVIITLTVSIAPAVGWLPATGHVSIEAPSVVLGAVALAVLALASPQVADARRERSGQRQSFPPSLNGVSLPATYAGCALFVIAGSLPWTGSPPTFHPVAALQAALVAIFIMECVVGNGLRLNLVRVTRATAILSFLAGAATFVIAYWSLTKGVGTSGAPVHLLTSLLANVGAMVIVGLIALTATAAAYGYGRTTYLTQYTPVSNAKQDLFLVSLLWLVLAWIPQTAAEHISRDDEFHAVKVLGIVFSIILLSGRTLIWITGNNDSHSGREHVKAGFSAPSHALPDTSFWKRTKSLRKRTSAYLRGGDAVGLSKEAARLEALDGHTAVQNAVALALVGVTLVGTFAALIQLAQDLVKPPAGGSA
ncbi:hypothetical protein ACIP9X_19160 [Arthrobacter sp. NPDC093125]|uniref:hypothetical protein n=1 Tax=Arthrobacter sp. NPDC093125 TaxID=3363944 RepID=UPI003816D49F